MAGVMAAAAMIATIAAMTIAVTTIAAVTIGAGTMTTTIATMTVAAVIGVGVGLVFANPMLGGVIAAAMLTNIVVAGLAGVLVPLTLERIGTDPAVSSSVFVTMTTDSMGFLAFLWLATVSGLVG